MLNFKNLLTNVTPKEWLGFSLVVAAGSLMLAYGVQGLSTRALAASPATIALVCLEFAKEEDQSVFNSTGVVRAGATISVKTEQDCKGQSLQQVTIK